MPETEWSRFQIIDLILSSAFVIAILVIAIACTVITTKSILGWIGEPKLSVHTVCPKNWNTRD